MALINEVCVCVCVRVCSQPGLMNQMITAAEERPWLWIVYVLTVALPVVLIIVFCCTGKVRGCVCVSDQFPLSMMCHLKHCDLSIWPRVDLYSNGLPVSYRRAQRPQLLLNTRRRTNRSQT